MSLNLLSFNEDGEALVVAVRQALVVQHQTASGTHPLFDALWFNTELEQVVLELRDGLVSRETLDCEFTVNPYEGLARELEGFGFDYEHLGHCHRLELCANDLAQELAVGSLGNDWRVSLEV